MKTRANFRNTTSLFPPSSHGRNLILIVFSLIAFSCSTTRKTAQSTAPVFDPVCNMKISDTGEAFTWKYKDKTYYFDSSTCKETFKMNPEKFINNSCNQVK
ncbi:MAG TPA: YHS domain-containing protein [Bacteroidia bacterium]|nr:YHS domain-containing protein [Bacteroidia bacterium]